MDDELTGTVETDPIEASDVDAGDVQTGADPAVTTDDGGTPDPWESLKSKGYDPEALEKSFTRFTQELEGVKSQKKELEPYIELKEMLDSDPHVLAAFEAALTAPGEDEDEVDILKRDLNSLKAQMRTEKELDALKQYVSENELPEVDEREVVTHAMRNNLGSLRAAYNDLNLTKIREMERQRALDEVKGVRKAKAVTQTAATTKSAVSFTEEQIAAMSPAEFAENRAQILAFYNSKKQ